MRFTKAGLPFIFLLFTFYISQAQPFTHADTLRGSNGPGRDWWDITHYTIQPIFNFSDSTITGSTEIEFKVLKPGSLMQIDLQEPLIIDSIFLISETNKWIEQCHGLPEKQKIETTIKDIRRDGNAHFITLPKKLIAGKKYSLNINYHGKPIKAKLPPWDGGLIWKRDKQGNPFISIACEGLGASVWYPCKDIPSDEPDNGAALILTAPDSLIAVGNGRLTYEKSLDGGNTVRVWKVKSPINNYNIIPYIGKYSHFSEIYKGEKGNLTMDYWVLDSNLTKAKEHFKDAPRMMEALEHWFGPYPFYEDGFKLVEAPHLGMEHQSAIAYGNQYKKGYLGRDLSGSGWGLKWDYIIIHESGHEWFGNNITAKDFADMWIQEGFTTYSEILFTEYHYGKQAGTEYVVGQRKGIGNKQPLIGKYGVNNEGSGDMYPKGANTIHTIRQVINNDELFRKILRGLGKTFYHKTITSKQLEEYISKESKINFNKVFDQYLRNIEIPVLEYKITGYAVQFRYTNCIKGFNMPLKVKFGAGANQTRWIKPTATWQTLKLADRYDKQTFSVDPNFYINTKKVE